MGSFQKLRRDEQDERDRQFAQIVGSSPALESVLAEVERVAPTDSTVLILGETGTGKELIARAVHNISTRCGRPFVKLNCAAIPFDLLESELFGHERGAFTGAVAQRVGRFEMADTGTLFLDEIGDLPLALQPKLLRVLQEQEFERLGSDRTQRINIRLVAATHRDLTEMVARNEFRSDLYYRLNVFPVQVPPLVDSAARLETLPTSDLLQTQDLPKRAELHWRLSLPVMCLLLALLAIPLSRLRPRKGRYSRVWLAVVIYFVYSNLVSAGKVWIARGTVPEPVGLWWVHIAVVLIGLGSIWIPRGLSRVRYRG